MAFSYTLVKYKDVWKLTNTNTSETLDYLLEKSENCLSYTEVVSGTLTSGLTTSNILILPVTEDGEYRLTLTDESSATQIVSLKYYLNLQLSVIQDVKLVLCDCECQSCSDCDDCITQLSAITKHGLFISLSALDYTATYTLISDYLKCIIGEDIQCVLRNEKYIGITEVTNSLKLLLSLLYLTMYFQEFNDATDTNEETYINSKFEFETISKCIMKLGININDIKDLF